MLDKDFIICKARTELSEFIRLISQHLDRPRKKFLRQVVGAILLSGTLIVTEMTRWIRDECSDRFYRLKRLAVVADQPIPKTSAVYLLSTSRWPSGIRSTALSIS